MQLFIDHWSAFFATPSEDGVGSAEVKSNVEALAEHANTTCQSDAETWPSPESVPKMQRRRMSAMAKMVFSQLESFPDAAQLPVVFSTRHGDLPKTVSLIEGVAENDDLSPTNFALSVHNAIAGQFGILQKNKQPSTVVSAGKDTFHQALLDASSRLTCTEANKILLIHADMPLPDCYLQYQDEYQLAHCVVMQLSASPTELTYHVQSEGQLSSTENRQGQLPQALQFAQLLAKEGDSAVIQGRYQWRWDRG